MSHLHSLLPDRPEAPHVRLRILQTTDLHVEILPYDYFADQPSPATGFALTASLIRQMRAEADNCLLFDTGDFLQGNPMSDWAAAQTAPDTQHPMVTAMNAVGFDGGTVGNHEFDYGMGFLEKALADLQIPMVSANIVRTAGATPIEDVLFLPAWHILERQVVTTSGATVPLRIGIIGFAPPQFAQWERFKLAGSVSGRDIVAAAQAHVPALRAAGADIVVALCHSGIGDDDHVDGMENAAVPLARVSGIDVLLTGHTHGIFPGPSFAASPAIDPQAGTLHGRPAVMAGSHGSHLGIIDLTLEQRAGGWDIVDHRAAARPVAADAETGAGLPIADAEVTALVRPFHQKVLDVVRRPVAQTTVPLSTHFALVAPSAAMTLVADLIRDHVRGRAADLIADAPLLVAMAPYKSGSPSQPDQYFEIPAGPLMVRHLSEIYPYPDCLCLLRMSGADIGRWLEKSALAFATVAVGSQSQPLRNMAVPGYHFDTLFGLRYTIDPSRPGGQRIREIRLASGMPLDPARPVVVAANSFRAAGGGNFDMIPAAEILHTDSLSIHDILLAGMRRQATFSTRAEQVWRFAALEGTQAWIDLAARAIDWAPRNDPQSGPVLIDLGLTPANRRRFSINFGAE